MYKKRIVAFFLGILLFLFYGNTNTIYADTSSSPDIIVNKDNFNDYFNLNGSSSYDQNTGVITLTPASTNQIGSFTLNSKIDLNTNFSLAGYLKLGDNPHGADGLGFAFHDGNSSDLGNAGGNLGIAGLQNAIGFKIDTWLNEFVAPESDLKGSMINQADSLGFGLNQDSGKTPYGAFVTTSKKQLKSRNGVLVDRWWAEDVPDSAKSLSSSDIDGKFHKFDVNYDGSSRLITISFTQTNGNVLKWTKKIDDSYSTMSFTVTGSTGSFFNEQQFKLDSFSFQEAATVDVKYVDTFGKTLAQGKVDYPSGAYVNGTYNTEKKEIKGYTFQYMDDGTVTKEKSLPATGTLKKNGNNGTVIYVYKANNYHVKFDPNQGANIMPDQLFTYNVTQLLNKNTFVRENYVFNNWNTAPDASGVTYTDGQNVFNLTDVANGVFTLYAQWKKVNGTVITKYVDQDGKEIHKSEVASGKIGSDYTTEKLTIDGYTLDESKLPANATGKYSENDIVVTYVYKKDTPAPVEGKVTTKYVDETGKEIHDPVTETGIVGSDYTTEKLTIDGYTLDESKLPANATGKYSENDIVVTYVYKKDTPAPTVGKVIIKFVDEDGNELHKPVEQTGEVGKNYTVNKIDIAGYILDKSKLPNNATGKYTSKDITVIFVYNKTASQNNNESNPNPSATGRVIIKFIDQSGRQIHEPLIETGLVGSSYTTAKLGISGYTLDESKLPNNSDGKFIQGDIIVTYVYNMNKPQVNDTPTTEQDKNNYSDNNDTNKQNDINKTNHDFARHVSNNKTAIKQEVSQKPTALKSKKSSLPKTGVKEQKYLLVFGTLLVLFIIYIIFDEKKHHDY
ncbi:hypothetical protein ERK17_03300 [Lactobacillus kullabergensis]|nr:hypothetical protein [Lactobacillus kullabergensis]